MMPRRMPLILIALLSLAVTACSGTGGTPEPTAAAKATAPAALTSSPGTSSNAAQGAAAGAAAAAALQGKFCADWTQGSAKAPPVAGGATAMGASPADLKVGVETTASFMKALADQAPTEIKPDFLVLAQFWTNYAAVMARNNFDFMRAATDPEFQKVASGADGLEKANANIQAWMTRNCGP